MRKPDHLITVRQDGYKRNMRCYFDKPICTNLEVHTGPGFWVPIKPTWQTWVGGSIGLFLIVVLILFCRAMTENAIEREDATDRWPRPGTQYDDDE